MFKPKKQMKKVPEPEEEYEEIDESEEEIEDEYDEPEEVELKRPIRKQVQRKNSSNQITKQEVFDMVEGNLARAIELLRVARGM